MTVILPAATRRSRFIFEYSAAAALAAPEQSLTALTGQPLSAAFSRALPKTAFDAGRGYRSVPHSMPAYQWAVDPTSGLYVPALLLEDTRTNYLLHNKDFSQAAWSKSGMTVVTNTLNGPDGISWADVIVETATNAEHLANQQVGTAVADNTVCTTGYTVLAGRSQCKVSFVKKDAVTVIGAVFDLIAGTVVSTDAGITARVTPLRNSFCRCEVSGSVGAGANNPQSRVQGYAAGSTVYLGNTGIGLGVVDAQFELGAFPSSIIATGAATVARPAERVDWVFNMPPGALTMYVKGVNLGTAQLGPAGTNPYYLLIGVGPNYMVLYEHTTGKPALVFSNNAVQSNAGSLGTNPAFGDTVELIATVTAGGSADISQCLNGGAITGSSGAGTAVGMPSAWSSATLNLNAGDVGGGFFAYQNVRVAAGVQTMPYMRAG
jgi:hypothetical protein